MTVFGALAGFIPLIILGVLTLGIVQLIRRANNDQPVDVATLTRQVVLFGLLYLTMILTSSGVVWAYGELTDSTARQDNRELAEALALVALGLPVFTVLLGVADKRLTRDEVERRSVPWSAYLTIASITALIGTMVGAYQGISALIDNRPDTDFDAKSLITVLIWGAFFATHWVVLRLRHGIRGDLHLAAASLVGLVPMAIGQAGLLAVLTERLYDESLGRPVEQLRGQSAPWAALFVVGCVVWIGIWLRQYESAPRTETWYVLVVPIGALAGFVATLGTFARLGHLALVWMVGDVRSASGADHFDTVPQLVGIGLTGLIAWFYHRAFLANEPSRTNILRAYDYLLLGASLVTGVVGALMIVSSLLDDSSTDKNLALAGVTLLTIGGFTWSRFASHIVVHQTGTEGLSELRSPVRRSYLYGALGVGGLAVLIAGVGSLERIFEDALDGTLTSDTIIDQREQLATVVIVAGVLWFHTLVLRSDHRRVAAVLPPPPMAHWPSRIIVLDTSAETTIDLTDHPGTSVEYWHRSDGQGTATPPPDVSTKELEDALAGQSAEDVLVLVTGDATSIIPFER